MIIPAVYLILKNKDHILLLKRYNTGFEDGKYSLIAGHVEYGETFTIAIIRETIEEAGIIIKAEDIKIVHIMHRKQPDQIRLDIFFIASKWQNNPQNMEPDKCSEMKWIHLDELPQNIIPFVEVAINNIKEQIPYSEYGWE